jgi:SAM-dependent methyltransferase
VPQRTARDASCTSSSGGAAAPPAGWPFFAPSAEADVSEALDLAGLAPGDHLVDLGCGDGQVLVTAARRGATVTGVECDRRLAAAARGALAEAGLADRGEVVVADLFDPSVWPRLLDRAPVLFGYLSPALLQRLTPLLRRVAAGRPLVTVDFDVPDLLADARSASARLYRLPGRRRTARPRRIGWPAGGTLCVMPTEVSSLTCLEAVHCGGAVELRLSGQLARHASAVAGADAAARGRPVAVDLRWREREADTLAHGEIHLAGLPPHPLIVLFAEKDHGHWDLSPDGRRALAFRLRQRSLPRPTTTEELLAAADR